MILKINFFWKLRKLKYYFSKNIVLDVGSGGDPYVSANVCFDKDISNSYLRDNEETYISPFIYTVISNGKNLPFKENFFTKTILSHVVEYNRNPKKLLDEVSRVSIGGILEGGNHQLFKQSAYPHMSLICNYDSKNNFVVYKKKFSEDLCKDFYDNNLINLNKSNPKLFHYRFEWNKSDNSYPFNIKYLNKDYKFNWEIPCVESKIKSFHKKNFKYFFKYFLMRLRSLFFSISYVDFLQCPSCKNDLIYNNQSINCSACNTYAKIKKKLIIFKLNEDEYSN